MISFLLKFDIIFIDKTGGKFMKYMPKAVFFDIDATTFQHNIQDVPFSTYEALRQMKNKGIKLGACTSRVGNELVNLPKPFLDLLDGIITCAGGAVRAEGKVIAEHCIHPEDARRVCQWCKENDVVLRWSDAYNEGHFDHYINEEKSKIFDYLYHMRHTLKPYTNENIVHMLLFPPMEKENEIRDLLQYSNLIVLRTTLEVTAPEISKASGVQTLAKHWGINMEDTMSIGDGKNDIDMFQATKFSIAMGQAQKEVKDAATYTTAPIDQDGFYLAFVHYGVIEDTLKLVK